MNERNFHIFYRMLAPPKPVDDHSSVNPKDPATGQPLETVDAAKIASESQKLLKREMTYYPDGDTSGPGEPQYWEAGGKQMIGLHPDKRAMCRLGAFEDYVYLNGGEHGVCTCCGVSGEYCASWHTRSRFNALFLAVNLAPDSCVCRHQHGRDESNVS